MDDLGGKVAVVTGAASGIGLALATRFAAEGMAVVLADVEEGPLQDAAGSLAGEHGADRVMAAPTDVRDSAAVDALAAATFERFGAAHVLCNNAGVLVGGLTWTVDPERWRWIVDVNVLGVANGIRAFVPRMIDQGEGHVVNTASAAGLLTGPAMAPYFATKHAVVALSEALFHDLRISGHAVGVSVVCPEWVRTRLGESDRNLPPGAGAGSGGDDPVAQFLRDTVLGHVAEGLEPSAIAGAVVDAMAEGTFWVLPHDTTLGYARQRWDAIAAGGEPPFALPS